MSERDRKAPKSKVFHGTFPDKIRTEILSVLSEIPRNYFFKTDQTPIKSELKIDQFFAEELTRKGFEVEQEVRVLHGRRLSVDAFLPAEGILIEIEKGKLPRIELDLIKIVAAAHNSPKEYRFGGLIVPFDFIRLPLEGRQSPYDYCVNQLLPLMEPIIHSSPVKGIAVFGYHDQRADSASLGNA
jgi:hypothetical protein